MRPKQNNKAKGPGSPDMEAEEGSLSEEMLHYLLWLHNNKKEAEISKPILGHSIVFQKAYAI